MDKIVVVVLGAGFVVLIGILSGIPVWLLWNWVIPSIFGLPEITLGQAISLSVLCSLLFKSSK